MSSVTLSMKMSPKATGALFSKACRLEEENEQLQARVAELESKIALTHERFRELEQNGGTLQPLREAFKSSGHVWLLRKQAEAVEAFISDQAPLLDRYRPGPINEKDHCCEFNLLLDRERLHSEAQRLRQQAEKAGGDQ